MRLTPSALGGEEGTVSRAADAIQLELDGVGA
jgi:hypothetical protein